MSLHILLYSVALLWLVTAYLRAEDRIRMVGPSAGEEAAKDLMEAVATSCNEMNYQEFMTHFTPKRAASIRKTMKHVFAQHDIEMEIHDVSLLSESEDRIVFALQYGWRDKRASPQVLYSEVVAVQTHNGWKIDSEKLKRSEVKRLPKQQFDLGGGGHVALSDDDAFWLPRDIVKRPGGCVGGRCGVGRSGGNVMGRHTEVATLLDAIKNSASARGRRYAAASCEPEWLATEIAEYCKSQGWKQSLRRLSNSASWVIVSDDVAAMVEGTITDMSVTVTDLNPVLLKTALVSCGLLALTGAGLVALPLAGVAAWRSRSRSAKVSALVSFIDDRVQAAMRRCPPGSLVTPR